MTETDRDMSQIEAAMKIEGTKSTSKKKENEGEKEGQAPVQGGSRGKPTKTK